MEERATEKKETMGYVEACNFVKQYMASTGKTQAQVAKELDFSSSALSGFLSGTYKTPHTIISKIEELANINTQKKVAPKEPEFTETSVTRDVTNAIRYAHLQGKISVVYGDAGIGKTMAFRNYLENNTLAIGITASPTYSSITGMNELIANQLGIRERVARRQTAEIVNRIKDSGRVLIIDEAQHLTVKTLDHLRCISDESGVGVCFIGNHQVYRKMIGSKEADFAQIFSRIGMRKFVSINSITKGDVQAVFDGVITEKDDFEILYRICRTHYGLRGAVNVFTNTANVFQEITGAGLTKMAREMNIG